MSCAVGEKDYSIKDKIWNFFCIWNNVKILCIHFHLYVHKCKTLTVQSSSSSSTIYSKNIGDQKHELSFINSFVEKYLWTKSTPLLKVLQLWCPLVARAVSTGRATPGSMSLGVGGQHFTLPSCACMKFMHIHAPSCPSSLRESGLRGVLHLCEHKDHMCDLHTPL